MDWSHPFSPAKAAAAYIRFRGLENAIIAGHDDDYICPIAGYLDRRFFHLRGCRWGSFPIYDREEPDPERCHRLLAEMRASEKKDVLLILTDTSFARPEYVEIAHFPRGIVPDEDYTLYLWKYEP